MSMSPRKVRVHLAGSEHILVSSESESYMRSVAGQADRAIQQVLERNPGLDMTSAAALAVVNAVDGLLRAQEETRHLRTLLDASEKLADARLRESDALKGTCQRLQADLEHLGAECDALRSASLGLPAWPASRDGFPVVAPPDGSAEPDASPMPSQRTLEEWVQER